MAQEQRRYTAEEWLRIEEQYREQPKRVVRAMFPDPQDGCNLGPFVPDTLHQPNRPAPEAHFRPKTHLAEWFDSLSTADVKKLEVLIALRPETVEWIAEKNSRELKSLDGAVEFITSSRTAARVLMWVGGAAVAFVAGVVGLTKNGMDLFAIVRGGK
ncbi:hypothetical protein [Methylobacterium sp. WL9]|uniref:hypothetical protein n=1 Tax=Methylobacterium sp. WL9 TaxID=2603898 RepID=UPI0011CC2555|nr:hypothetical protein [Methylobacterium sp. WL9]TXN23976.1 hypothetical protein FV217_04735 [Methylobacterium sp. WL9]